jgi:hypothetical protein
MDKFSGIFVYQEGAVIFARGRSGRVLFRYNSIGGVFGIFRSSRMTEEEMEFCLMMIDKYVPELGEEGKLKAVKFMKYEIDEDIFCS